jgi:hypothetical protein
MVETCWRVKSAGGRIITCGIYVSEAPGLGGARQVQRGDLLRSQRTVEISSAREVAEEWRQAVRAKGFVEVQGQ